MILYRMKQYNMIQQRIIYKIKQYHILQCQMIQSHIVQYLFSIIQNIYYNIIRYNTI